MAEYVVQDTSLTAIADAIREKAGLADSFVFPEGFVQAISGIEADGLDISDFGFRKAVFGTTTGSNSFIHNLGEYPKCVLFWSNDAWKYLKDYSTPQYYLKAGIAMVINKSDEEPLVVEGYSDGNSYSWYTTSPTKANPRTGFDSIYTPTTSNYGVCMNAPNENTVRVDGKAGSGYSYYFCPNATYNWGVFV